MATTTKDAKEETTTTLTSTTQLQREQEQAVYKTLDKARDEIKRSVIESRKEIPRVTEALSEHQQSDTSSWERSSGHLYRITKGDNKLNSISLESISREL